MRTVLSITAAAMHLGVRERFLAELALAGNVPHRKLGKDYTFDRDELDAWWDAQPGIHPATMPASPAVHTGDETRPEVPREPMLGLVRGQKGRNRERLKQG